MSSLRSCSVFTIFTCLFSLCALFVQGAPSKSNETDRAALLEFRSRISDDPGGIFSSWNETVDFCHWPGITCGRRHPRVTRLVLPDLGLGGSLSPYVGNLSFLRVIVGDNNVFTGGIPPEIGKLHRLRVLSLENNSFSGQLPENISACTNVREIWLGRNRFVGEIPLGLAAFSELTVLNFYYNNFEGKLPDIFGNMSSLVYVRGADNYLRGTIPDSLGRLQKLQWLLLPGNSFSGTLPASIFNITSLTTIGINDNKLDGGLPRDLGIALPNLNFLNFANNHLSGLFPPSLGNATNLGWLFLPINNFSGSVPDLSLLTQLRWLSISINQLSSKGYEDLAFVRSLNSTELTFLAFNENNFRGTLPQSIGNLSSKLEKLVFFSNQLTGTIPSSIGKLRNLETLRMGENPLTGILPDEIRNLYKLKDLKAQYCGFSGGIPSFLENLTMLTELSLAGNELQGSIPVSLGKCRNLIRLDLSENNLNGSIPSQVLQISSLSDYLDLSWNELTGTLPDEIGDLKNLGSLYVQENKLSGRVPNSLSRCTTLEELDMGNNLFEGDISGFLSPLTGLQYLDLSRNNFSGEIPKFLGDFQLTYLDLSFNHFEGELPNRGVFRNVSGISIVGNAKLCGGISGLNLPRCPTPKPKLKRKVSLEVATASGITALLVVLMLLAIYICFRRYRKNVKPSSGLVSVDPFPQISYQDILRATGGLSHNKLIGAGSFGSVYKGVLRNFDNMVAIKILDLRNRAASKSFLAECEVLRNIRHRNLVKIFTTCSTTDFQGNDFKALVYEYMKHGSLENWLHPEVAAEEVHQNLSLTQRVSIALDIACAVEYLHHECETLVIHCDLKPSNVLLDEDMTAHVSDFGLSRVLHSNEVVPEVSSVGVRGTIGYSPPEYGMGSQTSREGDVYSYGILLLEMFTGKRPTDDLFEDSWNIRSFCEATFPERAAEIADPCLFLNELGEGSSVRAPRRVKECLTKVLEVGIGCCRESPGERMDICEAAARLRSIKASLR